MSSSVTQSVKNQEIYLGFWTNWSYGSVRGATLTLTQRDGGLLLAFLALFVTVAGTCFWRIVCFILHYKLSSDTSKDGIYHQRQAILRNAANTTSGLWSLLQMNWVWRKHTQAKPYRRILPLIMFSVIIISGFIVASILSSKISTSMENEVLLLGSNCGFQDPDEIDAEYLYSSMLPYIAERTTFSANYAQECYGKSAMIQSCPTFLQKDLKYTSEYDIGCPFPGKDKICRSNSTNLRLDSGYINSNFDLGINSPPDDQFRYRTVVECAPLNHEGYSENITIHLGNNSTSPRQLMQYYYGVTMSSQMTYQYWADPAHHLYHVLNQSADPDYTLGVHWSHISVNGSIIEESSSFLPIPDLLHPMADVSLFFLSANDILFAEQSNDSWYSAQVLSSYKMGRHNTPGILSFYYRDDPVRILGCTSRFQFCNVNLESNSSCTPLTGMGAAQELSESLWQTERQRALSRWSTSAILRDAANIVDIVLALGVSSLTARYKRGEGVQASLPDNQWQLEAEHWFKITLADLQRAAIEQATGAIDRKVFERRRRPQTPEEYLLCGSQKIRNDSFTSFNTLGLAALLGIGGLMIIISQTLEFIIHRIQRRRNFSTYKRLEWISNDTLQIQRLAQEEAGYGTWMRTAEDYPVTASVEQLAKLDISDPEHPRLESTSANALKPHNGPGVSSDAVTQQEPASLSQHTLTASPPMLHRRHST